MSKNVDVSTESFETTVIERSRELPVSVKAFSGGAVVDQFVGALPPAAVRGFLDAVVDEAA